ncbi:MAG: MBL fold metallo-hydrolase [Selenomonadaceae bacterium]|nr:MBL fold metallo-hydrolase [Selenomonadaceae bacterium]
MLGTGNALVTECYNTCFVISDGDKHFLVDGGGGSGILRQLKHAGFDWKDMREIFLTHKHVDHFTGILWLVRMICQYMNQREYDGSAKIYGHAEVLQLLEDIAKKLLQPKETRFIGDRLHLIPVADGEALNVIGRATTFFDIHSTKAKQFGFSMDIGGARKLTCCGDEPCNDFGRVYARNADWLLHEAFCLYSQADIFDPYGKNHSTVKDACELAEELHVKNLLLYHTEDKNLSERKKLYCAEGQEYFSGKIHVPDDLETLAL